MLRVEHLSYEVEENGVRRNILTDVSFTVEDGEMLVVTGPNGGGKSTIAGLLMGIEPSSHGKIYLDGKDITGMNIDERANEGIGFAFQQPPRFKGLTASRLLSLAAGKELTEKECCSLLKAVGLCGKEYKDREVDNTLSGGEMKRIEIATVFAKKHKLSIFDEPEAGIDLWSFSMLVKQFEKMHREKKESILLISHQERIIRMADRIMVIKDGAVREIGKKEEILPHLMIEDAGGCTCMKRRGGAGNEAGRSDKQNLKIHR